MIVIPRRIREKKNQLSSEYRHYVLVEEKCTEKLVVYKCLENGCLETWQKNDFRQKGGEKEMITQCTRIIDYIREFGSITSFQAYSDLGVTQLGARIDDLQKQGYEFKREQKKGKNRFGETTYYIEYSLEE